MLINEFKKWSKENNVKYIEVDAMKENIKVINLYKKNKFVEKKITLISEI